MCYKTNFPYVMLQRFIDRLVKCLLSMCNINTTQSHYVHSIYLVTTLYRSKYTVSSLSLLNIDIVALFIVRDFSLL